MAEEIGSCQVEEPDRVDPSGIPEFTGDLGLLETAHGALSSDAGDIRDIGSDIHSRFQGLSAFYQAPEAEQLFATTTPVRDRADTFASDLESVGSSLSAYADEIRPLVERLQSLKAEADAFVAEIDGDDEWQYDGGKVERNNQLISDISTTVAEFWAAERRCANAITALVGGTQWTVDDGSGGENMYGMSVEDMSQAGETPWGKAVEEKHHWYEVGHHLKSFVWDGIIVDGIWGTITGLGTLLNPWSDNFGAAWQGLGQLATGLALLAGPVGLLTYAGSRLLPEDNAVRGWIDDSMDTTVNVGKSMVAWDEWSENPARAAGLLTFNVVTTVATLGAGTAVTGTGAAASATARAVSAAARVGNFIDPVAQIGRVAGAGLNGLRSIGNIASDLANITNTLPATAFPDGTLRLADGTVIPETGPLPDLPAGTQAVTLPDNTVRLPDGSTLHPNGQLDLPNGQTAQTADQIPAELSAVDRDILATTPTRDPELATVGTSNAGDNLPPTTAQTGDNLPPGGTSRPSDLPGPTAQASDPNLPPSSSAGAGGGGDLPPTGGVGDDLSNGSPGDDLSTSDPNSGPSTGGPGGGTDLPPGGTIPNPPAGNLPDGSWAGENGLRLDPEANAAADDFLRQTAAAEPRITNTMQDIAAGVDDGSLTGLDYRLKSEDSLKRKLATDLLENPNLTPEQALNRIKDSTRYTVEIPARNYTEGVQQAVNDLQARGFENVTFKNTWDSPGYKGINSTWCDPVSGQIFEVQFHTPESFAAKMDTHGLYETQRLPGVSPDEVARLQAQQDQIFNDVPVPGDAGDIHIGPAPDRPPPGAGASGANWVDEPSESAGRAYEDIRATPNRVDLPEISRNTGIDESVLRQVKSHLFRSQHDVPVGPGETRRGLFTPDDHIADLWQGARAGTLDAGELARFRSLMAHEYFESELMRAGLPYTSDHPSLWELDETDGTYTREFPTSLDQAGAHDLAPHYHEGHFNHWKRAFGIEPPSVRLADDLSNIDDVVNAAIQELRSRGVI
ncbi:hypothetical protein [Streptomyces sp. B6B3]|uniref:hypothetical protein n=1 Tax=Streptomyces sp. B6B3 TaxID=3153570 RepID=UPI00325DE5F3